MKRIWLAVMLLCMSMSATAAENPVDENRLRQLSNELRCLVCQNQSIADSSASLAVDLRRQIQEQMAAGRSDTEIRQYMVDRYGDFILYSPPFKASTFLLWTGPFLFLAFAIGFGIYLIRKRSRNVVVPTAEPVAGTDAEALWQKERERHPE